MGEEADDMIDRTMLDLYDDIDDDLIGLMVEGHQKHGHDGQPVQTDKAVLWVRNNKTEDWIPRSQIIRQEVDCIVITDWLAEKKGWVEHLVNKQPDEPKEEPKDIGYDLDDDIPF